MTFIGRCIPCQYGAHDEHHEVIEAVPEGVIGGAVCDCKGECVNEYVPPKTVTVQDPVADAELAATMDFLERASHDAS